QAVVTCRNDDKNQRLIGYVVTDDDFNKVRALELLESVLPHFMVPRTIIQLDKMPITDNGKIDKKSLPNPNAHHRLHATFLQPRTQTEKILKESWESIFPIQKISVNDNFFELGGNSLLAQ